MSRLKQCLLIPLLIAAWAVNAAAQALPESLAKVPGARKPAVGILDNSGFWGRDPEVVRRISARIQKLEQDHGYRILVVLESVLIGTTAPELANELRRQWLPEGDGLIVVFEADSRRLGIGQDMIGDPNQTENPSRIPSYETTAIVNRALATTDGKLAPQAFVDTMLNAIIDGLEAYFIRRDAPPPKERSVRTTLLFVGGLALLGLAVIGAGGLIRHSSMAKVRSYRFPMVDRPERLAAPCGASVTVRNFTPTAKR